METSAMSDGSIPEPARNDAAGCTPAVHRQDPPVLAGRLHPDYQPNLGKGFDGQWLEARA
jgi:hypothetical protein